MQCACPCPRVYARVPRCSGVYVGLCAHVYMGVPCVQGTHVHQCARTHTCAHICAHTCSDMCACVYPHVCRACAACVSVYACVACLHAHVCVSVCAPLFHTDYSPGHDLRIRGFSHVPQEAGDRLLTGHEGKDTRSGDIRAHTPPVGRDSPQGLTAVSYSRLSMEYLLQISIGVKLTLFCPR